MVKAKPPPADSTDPAEQPESQAAPALFTPGDRGPIDFWAGTEVDRSPVQSGGETPAEEKRDTFVDFLKELPILIIVAFAIALLIKTFLVQAFFIPSGSMENTLLVNDRVLVCKVGPLFDCKQPKTTDIVVFVAPTSARTETPDLGIFRRFWNSLLEGLGLRRPENDFIKRVIATEGQTIEIKEGSVFVDGKKLEEPYLHDQTPLPDFTAVKVPKDKVFVMGDNRLNSQDSRSFGPIPESSIVGRAFLLIWPPDRFRGL